jgi:CRP/FNR family transcriptional regulator
VDSRTILRKNASLSRLDDHTIEELGRVTTVQRLRRSEALWRAGERANSLVVVGHGLVKVLLPATGARDLVLGLFGPGESVGDAQVLDGAQYPAESVALTEPVTIGRVPRENLLAALERNGLASIEFARSIGRQVAIANRRIALFTASAEERLASTIIELGERFGDEMEDGSTLIPLRLTRAELAALVGTTVETTIRTLSRWSREGLVSTIDGGLTVHDPSALARRSVPPNPYVQTEPPQPRVSS